MSVWTPERFIYFFIGLAYLLVWIQVGLFHWRGAFRHWPMWVPVIAGPILALMGILFAFFHGGLWNALFVGLFSVGAVGGLFGVYDHLMGVRHYVGAWSLRNFMVGPPIVLPAIFSALSAAMLIVYFVWGV